MTETRAVANLLLERVVERMTDEMIDPITDPTQIGLFRSGKLQSSPLVAKLNVLVREGGEAWPDILAPADYPIRTPVYEFGGTTYFLRRFIADYELFYIGSATRAEARTISHVIFSRFHHHLLNCPLNNLTDDFGEAPIAAQVNKLVTEEGGGPPTSLIWRATHYFEFVTGIAYA